MIEGLTILVAMVLGAVLMAGWTKAHNIEEELPVMDYNDAGVRVRVYDELPEDARLCGAHTDGRVMVLMFERTQL